ncbi:MobF family relaxase, partial [Chroococcidiopsis cubana]
SVSIACLVGGDSRLEAAHRAAVGRTLEFIEQLLAETRIKGKRVKTNNLTVAIWHHDTSRELDPHLHSHCIAMNVTQLGNGKWQSRADEILYQNKMLLGQIYRNELALSCRKLGYEIEPHPKELFEIKGYTREQIEAFSKRHQQIVEKLVEAGLDATTENKIWAWRKTRVKKKQDIDREQMHSLWQDEAQLYGIAHPVYQADPQVSSPSQIQAQLQKVVADGIEHCAERKVAFKAEEIVKFVTAQPQQFGIEELQKEIASHPELIQIGDEQRRVTTQAAFLQELATIKLMQQGKGQVEEIAPSEAVEKYLEGTTLNAGQQQAVILAATTKDRFIAWQGVAGAGKTFALEQLKGAIETIQSLARSYVIKGFAPSAEAANVLGQEMGIEANTVARLLVSQPTDPPEPNQIWIVDEAGLMGAKDGYELLKRATAEGARVILVGDTRQLSSVAAGSPFKSLQQAGIGTAYLNESVRQRNSPPDLKQAVRLAADGDSAAAISSLATAGRVKEISDPQSRASRIAADYINLQPSERSETIILAGTRKECAAVTEKIRSLLKQEGSLGDSAVATQLLSKDLTQVQMRYTHYYNVGDVVIPVREYKRTGLRKFQPYTVVGIDADKLTLADASGNTLLVEPMKFRKAVYTKQEIEIAVGEILRWKKNQHQLGRRNGQEFKVLAIAGDTATIQYKDEVTETIDLRNSLHVEYAYLLTTYASQGKTAARTIASATKDRTTTKESAYVAMSRAKNQLTIYAESKQHLLEASKCTGGQENPIEVLQQSWGRVPVELLAITLSAADEQQTPEMLTVLQQQPIEQKSESNLTQSDFIQMETHHERPNSQQRQLNDLSTVGERVARRLESDSHAARPNRSLSEQPTAHDARSAPTARQPGAGNNRPTAEHERTHRLHHHLVECNQQLEQTNQQLELQLDTQVKSTPTASRTMPPTTEPAVVRDRVSDWQLSQHVDALTAGNAPRQGTTSPTPGRPPTPVREPGQQSQQPSVIYQNLEQRQRQADSTADRAITSSRTTLASAEEYNSIARERQRQRELLTQEILALSLEDVATQLGLSPKKGEKGKWCDEQLRNVSITDGKGWYDWNAQAGGRNATGLVMHVLGLERKAARNWLTSEFGLTRESSYISWERSPRSRSYKPQPTAKERQPFVAPVPDERKWVEVKQYLVEQRCLPASLVDRLHQSGKLYASGVSPSVLEQLHQLGRNGEKLTNAVFIRHSLHGEMKGASLRGIGSKFKGLAPGSIKDEAWFSFTQGKGEVRRIVLTESAIDAMSAAALAKDKSTATTFLATDGTGSVPIELLRSVLVRGGQVVLAQDADRAGQQQAWKIVKELGTGNIVRATPVRGKDWNEFLQATAMQTKAKEWSKVSDWEKVAIAIGRSSQYVERVKAIAAVVEDGQPLPEKGKVYMEQDFDTWKQQEVSLWQWWSAAQELNKPREYLERIADIALAFNHETTLSPISQPAIAAMQQDLHLHERLKLNSQLREQNQEKSSWLNLSLNSTKIPTQLDETPQALWQHYSQQVKAEHPVQVAGLIAIAAMKDGLEPQIIQRILSQDPQVEKIRQQGGEEMAHKYIKTIMQGAIARMPKRPHQQQQERESELEL